MLCHRDYHSRNLMWRDERLCIIDFQDARLGPDTYDLASLLRDSYVDLPEQVVDELIAYFLALQGRSAESAEFRRRFDLMALQRNLKALGTFGYQTTARRNPVYIQYIPRTLNYVRANLHRYPRFAAAADDPGAARRGAEVTRFGLSTHLFHQERLDERHLAIIRSHGFDLIELFATRTHFDYRDPARVAAMRGLAGRRRHRRRQHARADHRRHSGRGLGTGVLERVLGQRRAVRKRSTRRARPSTPAPRSAAASWSSTSACRAGRRFRPATTTRARCGEVSRRSPRRPRRRASRLALEVIPNDLSTPAALTALLESETIDLADAGICLDFGHAHMLGGAPEAVEALSGHVITTHVHDNDGTDDIHLVPFDGTIDWVETLTALWKIGYAGPYVFEVADHGDARGVAAAHGWRPDPPSGDTGGLGGAHRVRTVRYVSAARALDARSAARAEGRDESLCRSTSKTSRNTRASRSPSRAGWPTGGRAARFTFCRSATGPASSRR